jgi:hypothetical protein
MHLEIMWCRTVMFGRLVSFVKREYPFHGVVPGADKGTSFRVVEDLQFGRCEESVEDSRDVAGDNLKTIELYQDLQRYEALRVHLFPEIDVFRQIVAREIIVPNKKC